MSSQFDRRRFLELAGAGLVGVTLGTSACSRGESTSAASADATTTSAPPEDPPVAASDNVVARAWSRARTRGVPLLVLIDKADNVEASGYAWGTYLNFASDAAYADLALCELVYSRIDAAYEIWRDELHVDEPRPRALVVRALTPALTRVPYTALALEWSDFAGDPTATKLRTWMMTTESQLHAAIAPDEASFVQAAGVVLGAVPASRAAAEAALAQRAREALTRTAPPGAKWGTPSGCAGLEFDDGTLEEPGVACGMGHVDEVSRRFLGYLAGETR